MTTQAIVLNTVAKNEAHCIRRMLDSVRRFISHYAIDATGSTDETASIIREYMTAHGIPGQVYERPEWPGHAAARNGALDVARSMLARDGLLDRGYLMFVDADDTLEAAPGYAMPELTAPIYRAARRNRSDGSIAASPIALLARASQPVRWRGQMHEHIALDGERADASPVLEGVTYWYHFDGAQHRTPEIDARTEADRIALLERLIASPDEPGLRTHYAAYLWSSYMAQRRWADAARVIQAELRSSPRLRQDILYRAFVDLGCCWSHLGLPASDIYNLYCQAHDVRPDRAEAPFYAAVTAARCGVAGEAERLIAIAESIAVPSDGANAIDARCYGPGARQAMASLVGRKGTRAA